MKELFVKMTNVVSESSDDDNRKVGCVIVRDGDTIVAYGSNTIPEKVKKLKSRKEKPNKYSWIGHAERNAICEAAKKGIIILVQIVQSALYKQALASYIQKNQTLITTNGENLGKDLKKCLRKVELLLSL
jgi:deoxycytidylate deaminase